MLGGGAGESHNGASSGRTGRQETAAPDEDFTMRLKQGLRFAARSIARGAVATQPQLISANWRRLFTFRYHIVPAQHRW